VNSFAINKIVLGRHGFDLAITNSEFRSDKLESVKEQLAIIFWGARRGEQNQPSLRRSNTSHMPTAALNIDVCAMDIAVRV
jgi:hypothetical protein